MESAPPANPVSDSLQFTVQLTSAAPSDVSSSSKTMSMLQKRARKSSRPSTAPAKEEVILLPSLQVQKRLHSTSGNVATHPMQTLTEDDGSDHSNSRPQSMPPTPLALTDPSTSHSSLSSTTEGQVNESLASTSLHASSSSFEMQLQQPLAGSGSLHQFSATSHPYAYSKYNYAKFSYDWGTFISAYSSGRWDPHRTPNPPTHGAAPSYSLGPRSVSLLSETNPKSSGMSHGGQEVDVIGQYYNETEHGRTSHPKLPQDNNSHSYPHPNPYPKSIGSHRFRNSFSAATTLGSSSSSRQGKQPQPHPLESSLSTGSSTVNGHNVFSDAKTQKAKADLFLPLPHRLPLTPSGLSPGVGGQPLLSPSPVTAALHSNAFYSNSPHSHSSSSSSSESRLGYVVFTVRELLFIFL